MSPESKTIAQCLLWNGQSHQVLNRPAFVALAGVSAWPEPGQTALRQGEMVANVTVDTDTGLRRVSLILWAGDLFAFVYQHPDAPGARERLPDGSMAWHGSCMLKLFP